MSNIWKPYKVHFAGKKKNIKLLIKTSEINVRLGNESSPTLKQN